MRGMYLWNVTFKTKKLCLNALRAMILLYVVRACWDYKYLSTLSSYTFLSSTN